MAALAGAEATHRAVRQRGRSQLVQLLCCCACLCLCICKAATQLNIRSHTAAGEPGAACAAVASPDTALRRSSPGGAHACAATRVTLLQTPPCCLILARSTSSSLGVGGLLRAAANERAGAMRAVCDASRSAARRLQQRPA